MNWLGTRLDEAAGDWWHGLVAEVRPGVFKAFLGQSRSKEGAERAAMAEVPRGAGIIPAGEVMHMPKKIRDQLDAEFKALKAAMRSETPASKVPRPVAAVTGIPDVTRVPEIALAAEQVAVIQGDTFQLGEWIRAYLRRLPITEDNADLRELAHRPGVNWTKIAQSAIDNRR